MQGVRQLSQYNLAVKLVSENPATDIGREKLLGALMQCATSLLTKGFHHLLHCNCYQPPEPKRITPAFTKAAWKSRPHCVLGKWTEKYAAPHLPLILLDPVETSAGETVAPYKQVWAGTYADT